MLINNNNVLFTWCADVAASSIKLLTGTVTLPLLPAGQNMDIHWPRWKVLNHYPLVRTVIFIGPVDAARVPVSPINELPKHGHSKGVDGCADDNLPIGPCERASLNLLPDGRTKE